jgi:Fe-S oxidoreductase
MEIWLHGHCHQKALVGVEKTAKVLDTLLAGAKVNVIPSGCCGMAGSFGYEKEHYKTSLEIGEMVLFHAVRKAAFSTSDIPAIVAAPGTSCRQQILDGTGVKAIHPIEILYNLLKVRK